MEQNTFKRWNRIVGWMVFAVAAITYLCTIEPSSSLWDCGEFVATSYKLEVGHPPGAPLFMLLARIATMLAPSPYYVPHMVNGMNALASAFCILFLFWTITHIARRLVMRNGKPQLTLANGIAILGSGAVGALAYTFTDTFWFSAVEGEVYALSSMFTALVVWLMLRWEEEADEPHSARWIILIAYLMGLSIGVHILNLLTIPALVFIYYFRKYHKISLRGMALVTLLACAILLTINGIIIPYTVHLGALVDVFFVNTLSLPVNTGMIVFVLVLFALLGVGIYLTHRYGKHIFNLILVCLTMIMLGFSSYAAVSIRASVNPPMNSNNPDNPTALLSMLNREQYGNHPLIYGPSYASPIEDVIYKEFYDYNPETGKYEKQKTVADYEYPSNFKHFFPRMWNQQKEKEYKHWAAYRTKVDELKDENGEPIYDEEGRKKRGEVVDFGKTEVYEVKDERGRVVHREKIVVPTFGENMKYFFSYQLNYMYWRYFLWNFVGRQDDIQPDGNTITNGNWISGIDAVDETFIGPQQNLPREMAENKARNTYFFLPFLLGLIGLIYQLNRDIRNFTIVMWLFVMMGIALVVYFNTSPGEVRERDYVYAGSFYAFSMWIGLGVLALYNLFTWLLKRYHRACAIAAVVVGMAVPTILCAQNWDDHDRSHRTMARDLGYNYLSSIVEKEGVSPIIVNYGDNDTFPLWFNQEVDGVRPDVRIMNSSYLDGEWYVDEMKCKANKADGIPFSLPSEKYTYKNDWIAIDPNNTDVMDAKNVMAFVCSDKQNTKTKDYNGDLVDFIPTNRIALPVDKKAAIASGIVAEKDYDLMVDTVYINIRESHLSRSELMLLDMFAHFDWERPIYFTQVYVLQKFGLLNYLQFDGYAYRFVPIYTPFVDLQNIGRIDADYAYDKLMNTFRYGNLADPRVYVDEFTQYNLKVSRAREAFARVAREYIKLDNKERAEALLDRGLAVLPINQLRFTEANTLPFIECYYELGLNEKGDNLLRAYRNNVVEYIDYYLQFKGEQGEQVESTLYDKMQDLSNIFSLAVDYGREEFLIDPFVEKLYEAGSKNKADKILMVYCSNLMADIDYYLQFEGEQAKLVEELIYNKMDDLSSVYNVVVSHNREMLQYYINDYYRSLGAENKDLILTESEKKQFGVQGAPKTKL